jgi:hypothetical protein
MTMDPEAHAEDHYDWQNIAQEGAGYNLEGHGLYLTTVLDVLVAGPCPALPWQRPQARPVGALWPLAGVGVRPRLAATGAAYLASFETSLVCS